MRTPATPALHDWTVLSLRPRGQHAALRAAAARHGAATLALSTLRIDPFHDAPTRAALAQALRADIVIHTSRNAVAAAAAMQALRMRRGQTVLAVGDGTRRALQRHGVPARAPPRMDSEGVLAMAELAKIAGRRIGLVTGVGGRDRLAPALRTRGADVVRVDVYARNPLPVSAQALARLEAALAEPRRVVLALSSGEALQQLLATLPVPLRRRLPKVAVVAASARLAGLARAAGFGRIAVAADARPASLIGAAARAFG